MGMGMGCGCGEHHCEMGMHGMECHQCQGHLGMMGPKMMMKKAMKKAVLKLLVERLKPRIEQQMGGKLDQIADLMVQTMMVKRNAKVDIIKQKMALKQQMQEILLGDEEEEEEEEE